MISASIEGFSARIGLLYVLPIHLLRTYSLQIRPTTRVNIKLKSKYKSSIYKRRRRGENLKEDYAA